MDRSALIAKERNTSQVLATRTSQFYCCTTFNMGLLLMCCVVSTLTESVLSQGRSYEQTLPWRLTFCVKVTCTKPNSLKLLLYTPWKLGKRVKIWYSGHLSCTSVLGPCLRCPLYFLVLDIKDGFLTLCAGDQEVHTFGYTIIGRVSVNSSIVTTVIVLHKMSP